MDDRKIEELLLKLLEDMAILKEKMNGLEEIKEAASIRQGKIEKIEMATERQEKQIAALEHRNNELEAFVRGNVVDSRKTQTSILVSIVMAILSVALTFIFNLL